jgi:hypothetical protein
MATELRGQSTNQTIRALNFGEGPARCGAYFSCQEVPAYAISYEQKTSKALANNSDHRAARPKYACAYHGLRFAERHDIPLPNPPAPPVITNPAEAA